MPVSDLTDSRAATNALLGMLQQDRWRPHAVARFLWQAADRSARQAARRPRALGQITALHGLLLARAGQQRPGRGWVAASWVLGVVHLGLLEHRDRLAPADVLTLIRGNLPATVMGSSRWSGLLAIALDLADGRLARSRGTVSPFGDYADSFADAAYWTWLTLRHEPSRAVGRRRSPHGHYRSSRSRPSASTAAACPSGPAPHCCARPPPCRASSPCATSYGVDRAPITGCCCRPSPARVRLRSQPPARTPRGL